MSLDNVGRFIDAAVSDRPLQQKLAAVRDSAELARLAVKEGSERGLRFTEKEFLTTIGRQSSTSGGELSDDALEGVAGGMSVGGRVSLTPNQLAVVKLFEKLV